MTPAMLKRCSGQFNLEQNCAQEIIGQVLVLFEAQLETNLAAVPMKA
jgi:hypothetical protein